MPRKQRICRFVFVFLGVLPLLATIAYAGWRNHHFSTEHFADQCGRSLGCLVTIRKVDYARPGAYHLVDVTFSDAESGRSLLHCDQIAVHDQNGTQRFDIPNLEVAHAIGDQVIDLIHERVLCQPKLLSDEIIISIDNLRFGNEATTSTSDTVTLIEKTFSDNVTFSSGNTIELRQIEDGTELRADFHPMESIEDANQRDGQPSAKEPVELLIRRHFANEISTRVSLRTFEHELPARLLAGQRNWLPQITGTFRGNIDCDLAFDGWSGEVAGGYLRNVELTHFLGGSFGDWIQGTGDLVIRTAQFSHGRIGEVDVDIYSKAGRISVPHLQAATETWHLAWDQSPLPSGELVPYQELACGIYLDSNQQLELRGRAEPAGTLLKLSNGPRLSTGQMRVVRSPLTTILTALHHINQRP